MSRSALLLGAMVLAGCIAAAPADATVTLSSTPATLFGFSFGTFDLSPYLHDAQGRTFAISAATLSAQVHSDPNYGAPTTTTVDTSGSPTLISFNPLVFQLNTSRVVTTTYIDAVADKITLSNGLFDPSAQSVTGAVSQVLDTTETTDGGFIDAPAGIPGITNHITVTDVTIRHAIYGSLDLSEVFTAASLGVANLSQSVNYFLLPDGVGFGSIPGFPGIPGLPGGDPSPPSQFSIDSVTFAFDRTQTGGPPPTTGGIPEPASWALMILGFGAVGATLRRRQGLVA